MKQQHKHIKTPQAKPQPKVAIVKRNYVLPALAAILVITAIVFSPCLSNGFVNWDDPVYILNNNLIKDLSWKGIKLIFSNFNSDNYAPLTDLISAVQYKISGLNPGAFHFGSLVVHLLNVGLVFLFIQLLCGRWEVATITALFFGIHPMQVESVAWASARSNLFYATFFLGSLISYFYYLKRNHEFKYLFISLLLFGFSIITKAIAIVLPLVLILIDNYEGRKVNKKAIFEKIPFFIISFVIGILTLLIKHQYGNLKDLSPFYTIFQRIIVSSSTIILYIFKLLIPVELTAFYTYPSKLSNGSLYFGYYLSPLIILIITYGIIRLRRFKKEVVFGFLFFSLNIIFFLQIIPIGGTFIAERYVYVPCIGLFFIAGRFFSDIIYNKFNLSINAKNSIISVMLIIVFVFAFATWNRNKVWKDTITLWTDVVNKNSLNETAYYNLGDEKYKNKDFKGAITDYDEVIKINNQNVGAIFNRAGTKFVLNDYRAALLDYDKFIQIKPLDVKAYLNRGITKEKLNDYTGAIADYSEAIRLNPKDSDAFYNRATARIFIKDYFEAIQDYNQVIKLNPKHDDAYYNRGNAKIQINDFKGAINDYDVAISLNPQKTRFFENRALAKFRVNNFEGAISDYNEVIALSLKMGEAYFSKIHDFHYTKMDDAYYNKGLCELWLQRMKEACEDLRKAKELGNGLANEVLEEFCL